MNQRNRRSFTKEFKHEAASLVVDQGYSMAEACRAMGVGSTALRRWVLQLQGERNGVTPKPQRLSGQTYQIILIVNSRSRNPTSGGVVTSRTFGPKVGGCTSL